MELVKHRELKEQLTLYCQKINVPSGDVKFISTWIGDRISSLEEEDYKSVINRAIAEVCLLNGLETYDEEKQPQMYVAQMRIIAKFISEGFGYLTPMELINAFHLNLQGKYSEVYHQYADKKINCEFIGQVLAGYKNYKQTYVNLNPDLIGILNPPEQPKQIEYKEDIENDERLMVEREYQKFLTDPKWNKELLLECVYNRIEADELVPKDFYHKFIRKAKIQLARQKQLAKFIPTSVDKVKSFDEDGSIGYILQKNFDMNTVLDSDIHQIRNGSSNEVKHFAFQLAVAGYFTYCLKKKELKNIYRRKK